MKNPSPRRKTVAVASLLGACALILSACGSGADAAGADGKITFGVGAPVLIDSTAPYGSVPLELDYWKDEGLDVDIQPTQGATASMQLLLAGKADIVNGGSSAFFQAAAKSPELRVISLQTKNIWQIVVPKGSATGSIESLKGKTIGVQSFSSASYLFGRAAVEASGLDADKDVKWLSVGVGNQAAAAFKGGEIDAYATYDGPSGVVGSALGEELVNLPTPLDDIPGLLGIATTEKFLKEHRDLVVKFLIGLNKGAVFSGANPAAALQIQWKAHPEQKPKGKSTQEAIDATLPSVASRFALGDEPGASGEFGDVPADQVQSSIDFMAKYGILAKTLDGSKIVDLSLSADSSKFDVDSIVGQAKNWKP